MIHLTGDGGGHPRVVVTSKSWPMYKKLLCWRFKMKMVKSLLLDPYEVTSTETIVESAGLGIIKETGGITSTKESG